jgi:hypothetical protein
MKKHLFVAGAGVLALGFTASMASAQCSYEHPKSAKQLKSALVQAMVSCNNPGGNTPNATTEGGVPTCKPPETYHEQAGSPGGGWTWDELKGKGDVTFKASKNKVVNPNNPPADTADLAVQLKMSGILDDIGPANGPGTLATVARATLKDRVGGDMTVVDFPAGFAIQAVDGKISKKTSANVLLNGIGQPGLPGCSSIEVVSVNIVDPNGNAFANMGTFLPPL